MGPDIHLETKGSFYLPDVQKEHRERLFKNFPPQRCKLHRATISLSHEAFYKPHLIFRVNDMKFPANLEAFFASKEGLKIQSQESAPPDPKATAGKESDEKEALQPGIASASASPDEGVSPPRSASPCTSCPLCSKSFPLEVMVHKLYVKKSNMLVTIKNPGA